jgi:DNA-binding PadR family transcriptional regulator
VGRARNIESAARKSGKNLQERWHTDMRHRKGRRLRDGSRHRPDESEPTEDRRSGRHSLHGPRFRERRSGRPFEYGEFRLVALAMIAEQPRHGYELMKAIKQRTGGTYSPSPGVIYPALAWLEEMRYVSFETEETGKKRYRITTEGEAFLDTNRAAMDALLSWLGEMGGVRSAAVQEPVLGAMQKVEVALRLRLRRGVIDQKAAEAIASALDAAAQKVERS